ncbi:MAG: SprT-like domain-containing protein [Candidatus Magnetominusculus sp. LBB02]|nr:SprT-like domain-containing protein [Candidatus Magnetominusculus sp. LBB02]
MNLPPEAELAERLRHYMAAGVPVGLTLTDNSSSMLSVRRAPDGKISIRAHRMFLNAGAEVIEEIAAFVRQRKKQTPLTRQFIRENKSVLKKRPKRAAAINPQGKYHDLMAIYSSLNEEYFDGSLSVDITWGRRQTRGVYRKRRLGSYDAAGSLIRIHPALDKPAVPRFFIEYIVYHEMLHAAIGIRVKNGRRTIHGRDFKLRERLFRDYGRAMDFLKYRL